MIKADCEPHSEPQPPVSLSTCSVFIIPILDNNYCYLVVDRESGKGAVVDPADAKAVLRAVRSLPGVELTHVLTTHRHHDHAGGNLELVAEVEASGGPKLVVVGGRRERVPGCTLGVADGDVVKLGSTRLRVMETPCHTRGHVLFCVLSPRGAPASAAPDSDVEAVFTGDTVFVGGVGAFFHGSAAEMERNLTGRLAGVPDGALLYCGHEYSHDNLRFAAWVEPENPEVLASFLLAGSRRSVRAPTVPSSFGIERRTNPYFRAADPALRAAIGDRLRWAAARERKSLGRRAWEAVVGEPSGGGGGPGPPQADVYRSLQKLLGTGAWQSFRLSGRNAAAARRRAAALEEVERRGRAASQGDGAV